jgi:hypothetical protein
MLIIGLIVIVILILALLEPAAQILGGVTPM